MNETRNPPDSDLDKLTRLKALSWLSISELGLLSRMSRGTLLKASFSHQDIADLVGASRPRVTEHLAQLEREHLIIRQGRQLIVCVDKLGGIERTAIRHDDDASAKLVS